MDWFGGRVSLSNLDLAGAVNKLSESVKNIECNFDTALFDGDNAESSSEASVTWSSNNNRKALFDPVMAFMGQKEAETPADSDAGEIISEMKDEEIKAETRDEESKAEMRDVESKAETRDEDSRAEVRVEDNRAELRDEESGAEMRDEESKTKMRDEESKTEIEDEESSEV